MCVDVRTRKHALREKGEDKAFRGPGRNAAADQRSEVADLKKRLAQLEEENAILKKSGGVLRQGAAVKYAFIASQQRQHSVSLMCWVLQASRSGYYAWKARPLVVRQQRDRALLGHIRRAHEHNRQAYGYLKT